MKLIIQRVSKASLSRKSDGPDAAPISQIGPGIFVLVGITHDDTDIDVDYLVKKLLNLKMWPDSNGGLWK